jgi:thymidine kinase
MEAVAFDDEDALIDYILEEHGLPNVVAIDEAQFFSRDWIAFVRWCEKAEVALYVTGLNQDFRGEPFGIMPTLMAMADNVTLLDAVCMSCGGRATRTQRLINGEPAHWDEPTVLVGGDESYEPRCVMCHEVPRSTTL